MKKIYTTIMIIFILAIPFMAFGQEISILAGISTFNSTNDSGFAVKANYEHHLYKNLQILGAYLNEGHVSNHKRDGFVIQPYLTQLLFNNKLALGVGIGPYRYFDTVDGKIDHGWGTIISASATYYTKYPIFFRAEVNRIEAGNNDSDVVLAGIGYKF